MPKQPSPTPPTEALPDGEANRYLAKVKTSLCKRWSVTKMETLYEIADLAVYLWALERPGEAVAVAASVTTAVPAPPPLPRGGVNYNVWCPATFSHALVVRLGATPGQVEASRAALLADAGVARDNPAYLAEQVAEARQLLAVPPAAKPTKWEYLALARAIGRMLLYAELATAGDSLVVPLGPDAVALVPQLLANLGARLQAA